MNKFKVAALAATVVLGASPALAQQRFQNPCERGPLPRVSTINSSRTQFVLFLQEIRPGMPVITANNIADDLCEDMSLVGDSQGLTLRLNELLRVNGY